MHNRVVSGLRGRGIAAVLLAAALAAANASCASSADAGKDPLGTFSDAKRPARDRVKAVDAARAEAGDDTAMLAATHRAFRTIVWDWREPAEVRLAALGSMMNDPEPSAVEEARSLGRLLVAREQSPAIVAYISGKAAERNWTEYVYPLIRSYARPWAGPPHSIPDSERAERAALEKLLGTGKVEEAVFAAFVKPPDLSTYGEDWAMRFRADAWELLARLDGDGSLRTRLLNSPGEAEGDATVRAIRRAVVEVRSMPVTGEELKWLLSLLDPAKPENAAWWREAAAAAAMCPPEQPLALRQLEAVRWTAKVRPEWLRKSREELLSELSQRLSRRTLHQRSNEKGQYRVRDGLTDAEKQLKWGDLITILVVDDAVRQPQVLASLSQQIKLDRKDKTTEYGGTVGLRKPAPTSEPVWMAMLYPPRPGQRRGDEHFIASDDMLAASDRALSHYHFHVQKAGNAAYAGPSPNDLTYAARMGRTCVVFTSISDTVLNVDYYQPNGAVVDLGELNYSE